jgi:hypothetical protein
MTDEVVRIRRSRRSPYSGEYGAACSVDLKDQHGACLVQFDDGLKFRYSIAEIELIPAHATTMHETHSFRRAS